MQLSLISPEGIVFTGDVEMIVIPGAKGDFGVLNYHAPFMTMLRNGTVNFVSEWPESAGLQYFWRIL